MMFGTLEEFVPELAHNIMMIERKQQQKEIGLEIRHRSLQLRSHGDVKDSLNSTNSRNKNAKKINNRPCEPQQKTPRIQICLYDTVETQPPPVTIKYRPSHLLKSRHSQDQYTASDKAYLLSHYDHFRKQYQEAGFDQKRIESMHANHQKAKRENTGRKGAMSHMKGKLRPNHHLLQAMVQVEQMQAANPQTFFDISLKHLEGQMREIKLENRVRGRLEPSLQKQVKQREKEEFVKAKDMKIPIHKGKLYEPVRTGYTPRRSDLCQTLMLENRKKWLSVHNSYSKTIHSSAEKRSFSQSTPSQTKQLERNRRSMFKKISNLVSNINPAPSRMKIKRKDTFSSMRSSGLFRSGIY